MTSGTRSSTGGSRRSPRRRSSELGRRRPARRASRATSSIPARGVDADHADAGLRDRHRDPAGADGELDDGPARRARLLDVEVDVLGDARGSTGRRRAAIESLIRDSSSAGTLVSLGARVDAPAALETRGAARLRRGLVGRRARDARVDYLGRKSELKQALREVRDRETGMALNAVRERLEGAIDAREAELSRAGARSRA